MKPKPFSALNHFTEPCAMSSPLGDVLRPALCRPGAGHASRRWRQTRYMGVPVNIGDGSRYAAHTIDQRKRSKLQPFKPPMSARGWETEPVRGAATTDGPTSEGGGAPLPVASPSARSPASQ